MEHSNISLPNMPQNKRRLTFVGLNYHAGFLLYISTRHDILLSILNWSTRLGVPSTKLAAHCFYDHRSVIFPIFIYTHWSKHFLCLQDRCSLSQVIRTSVFIFQIICQENTNGRSAICLLFMKLQSVFQYFA